VAREQRLKEVAAETGIRVIGPSSLGVVNLREGLLLTANAAFAEPDIPAGRTFFASHSGTMIGALMSRGKARGVGFAGLVSIGNEVDLSVGEICACTLDDPDIDSYLLFLESIRNAPALREFALGAAARGKPVVAYKLGRSSAARELAVTHTGALAGEDDVASAFLADCGIARVESLEALIEALPLVRRTPIRPVGARAPRVAVLTTTAGGAIMVVDPLAMRGVEIAQPSAETFARFAAVFFLALHVTALAEDWPQWRGPHFNGSSNEKGLPSKWSKEDATWSVNLPGSSAATPVVQGDHVFVSTSDLSSKTLHALCLDRKTGRILWNVKTSERLQRDEKSNFASPSPVADGHRVFFFYGDGSLVAFDHSGKELWSRSITKDYGDFEMWVDWKITKAGDSGIYLRGQPQVQIWDSDTTPGARDKDIGSGSGAANTTGGSNTYVGTSAGNANLTGLEVTSFVVGSYYSGRVSTILR
jgi:hypothetical protein